MRRPLRPNTARKKVARSWSLPAPVEGWDASSPLADMGPARAIIMENFFPEPGYARLRRGYSEHASGIDGAIETLMSWDGPSSSKLFAAGDGAIYDASTPGAAGSAEVSGLSNTRFGWTNFTTSGGHFLWICNGEDAPQHYNGSTWAEPTITGITPEDVISVTPHKQRLWLILKNSTKAAYLGVSAIAGAATTFELGGLFKLGGQLLAIGTWTRDGGDGVDDYCVFVSSRGEVIVYQGLDPNSSATWSMVGRYRIGEPIGRRCIEQFGGELYVVTKAGVVPISRAITIDATQQELVTLTQRISAAVNEATRLYGDNFGWQLIGYPSGTMAVLNVPKAEGTIAEQFCMNTLTGAWCRFTGMKAVCWALFDGGLYFGAGNGKVYKADDGASDDGGVITYDVKPAFSQLGMPGMQKQVSAVRLIIGTDGAVSPALAINVDFGDTVPSTTPTFVEAAGSAWDEADWDDAEWGGEVAATPLFASAFGVGDYISPRIRGQAKGVAIRLYGSDVLFHPGGFV